MCFGESLPIADMETISIEPDSHIPIQLQSSDNIVTASESPRDIVSVSYRMPDMNEEFMEQYPEMFDADAPTRRNTIPRRSPKLSSDDEDFTPPANSTMIKSRPKSRGRRPASRTRSKTQRSKSIKPSKSRQRSTTRKTKSRSRSRSASASRKAASRGRRGRK
ncbi:unnamed protein product [Chironomus riparius]|uniref:Uncharacterized protein n=1 Tax=Chironomus riparius TaxID=315576 RepID=A0A9N9RIY0_9DIPT|nr:unnamed protein product [Chironomus riparius]